jgi:hypothetical protein
VKCKLCDKKATDTYCELHKRAYCNVIEKYDVWKMAFFEISWYNYLIEVVKNEYSGSRVKEVARDLLSEIE